MEFKAGDRISCDLTRGKARTYYIYFLIDPRTYSVFYVGKAADPAYRLYQHWIGKADSPGARSYIRDLLQEGVDPILEIAAVCESNKEAEFRERLFIHAALMAKEPLVNQRKLPSKNFPSFFTNR